MASEASIGNSFSHLSSKLMTIVVLFLLTFGVLTTVRLYTTYSYRRALLDSPSTASSKKASSPPRIPYTIPFFGHAFAFLAPRPGEFWAHLFRSHNRATGACTLHLGGKDTHILFSPSAVKALFRDRGLTRDGFNLQIAELGLGIHHDEALRFFGIGEGPDHTGFTPVQQQERINHSYLLEKKSVNELTGGFTTVFQRQLSAENFNDKEGEINGQEGKVEFLYAWLQERLFQASAMAFMGSRLLDVCPDLRTDFFNFDRHMLTMFFRIPKIFNPTPYNVREKTLNGLITWQHLMLKECNGNAEDPEGDVDWEPVFGSRANRARQRYYASRGLSFRTRAAMDLGFLFALGSNAIPAAGWMLMHLVNPQGEASLLGRVMEELETSEHDDGSLDIPTLIALPLLQSVYHEVLRLYVDVLVTRELKEDLTLPLDDGEKRKVFLKKDTIVMAPSWLGHRDPALWVDPPYDQFYGERFLKTDPETGKQVFTTSGTNGKFFPFGGGKTICPGRVFAKQEVLASVALVLLTYDIAPLGFVDEQGKPNKDFPGLRKSYSGSGIMATDADMKVRINRRKR